jgi:hypothetical protein
MNTIKMPGFTAENAIFHSEINFNMLGSTINKSSSGVNPQAGAGQAGAGFGTITIEPEQCVIRCRWRCTRYGCWPTDCYEMCF